jgi:hypothetical protein
VRASALCLAVLLASWGCATSQPILYPTAHYQAVGAAAGAVGGAVAGFLGSLFSRDRNHDGAYRSFVDRCLRERGYETTGWS